MIARRWYTALITFAATFCVCRVTHANSLSPYVYFWPGVISVSLVYAFPASLLVAILERPFLTAAGIARRPLVFSLRANFLSTIAGILLIPICYPALYMIGPFWCILAFGVSCAVEVVYLRKYSYQSFAWGWIVGGNAISSAVLMVLPMIAIAIGDNNRLLAWTLKAPQVWLAWLLLSASVAAFLGSFAWVKIAESETMPTDSDIPASAVGDPECDPITLHASSSSSPDRPFGDSV